MRNFSRGVSRASEKYPQTKHSKNFFRYLFIYILCFHENLTLKPEDLFKASHNLKDFGKFPRSRMLIQEYLVIASSRYPLESMEWEALLADLVQRCAFNEMLTDILFYYM